MIKAIIFDLWHTLAKKPSVSTAIKDRFGITAQDFKEKYERTIQLQQWDTLDDMVVNLLRTFEVPTSESNVLFAKNAFKEGIRCAYLNPKIKSLLSDLSKNYKLAILSNTSNFEVLPRDLSICKFFDVIAYSWLIGSLKPAREGLHAVCNVLGVAPDECMLVDDLEKNVMAARSYGLRAVRYKNSKQLVNDLGKYITI